VIHDNEMDLLSEGCPTFSLAHLAAISFCRCCSKWSRPVVSHGGGQCVWSVLPDMMHLCLRTF